jgi:hypothetical protein
MVLQSTGMPRRFYMGTRRDDLARPVKMAVVVKTAMVVKCKMAVRVTGQSNAQ